MNTLKMHCKKCNKVEKATVTGTIIYTNCVDSHVECNTCGTVHTVSYPVSMSAILPDATQKRLLLDDEQPEVNNFISGQDFMPKGAFHWELDLHYPNENH
jgi:hypothetical protein